MSENQVEGEVPVSLQATTHHTGLKNLDNVLIAVIRVRGKVKKPHDIKKTLALFRLFRQNHAVIVKATKSIAGMLFKIKDFAAMGPIDKETLVDLLKKKARLEGHRAFDLAAVKALTGKESYEDLADALMSFEITYADIPHITPIFRLHPPSGGFLKGTKVPYTRGGPLGNMGEDINKLLERMI
jgi:large subunit ribosomal protein L30